MRRPLPLTRLRRAQDSASHLIGGEAVAECRRGRLARFKAVDEVGGLMDEAVLVADLEPRHPPVLHIRMIAVRDVERPPAAYDSLIAMVEILQAVKVVEVPEDRGVFPIDFERIERLVAASVASGFERGERAIREARKEEAGVVDADRLDLAREIVTSFLDEGFCDRCDLVDASVQPHGRIDAVRQKIAGDPAARDACIEPPKRRAALRQIFGDRPVLQELRPVVIDLAEPSLVDEMFGERHRRHAAIVVPHHVRDAGLLDRGDHLRPLRLIAAERLLTHDHFARLGGSDRDLGVRVIGRCNVNQVDVLPRDELSPVGFGGLVVPVFGEGLDLLLIPAADRFEHRLAFQIKELAHLSECIRVGAAHEAIPDDANIKLLLFPSHASPIPLRPTHAQP